MAKKSPSTLPSSPENAPRQITSTPVDELLAQAAGPGDKAEEFIHTHWRKLVIATVGALLLIVMVVAIRGYQQYQANLAAQAFTSASSIDEFEAVVRDFPTTIAGGNALLRKADLLWTQGETQQSIDTLEQFLRDFEKHPLRPQTLISLGSRLEDLERPSAAEVHYRNVIENFAETPYAPMAQIRLAEVELAAGNEEAGRSLLERMPSTFPLYGPSFIPLAEERVRQLDAKLPTSPIPPPADAPARPVPQLPGLDLEPLPEFMPDGLEIIPGLTPQAPVLPGLGEEPQVPALPEQSEPSDASQPAAEPSTPESSEAPATEEAPAEPAEEQGVGEEAVPSEPAEDNP